MRAQFIIFFLLTSFIVKAQNDITRYYDINRKVYKEIVVSKNKSKTIFYDENEGVIDGVCDSSQATGFIDQLQASQKISELITRDSTQSERKINFCFIITDNKVRNVRLIKYDSKNLTSDEVLNMLKKALSTVELNLTDMQKIYVEYGYVEYVPYPVKREKKNLGYKVE